jgi:alkyl sulfatase BDS1-like metallo-beta-lactamase superfamily hydrolase
MFDPGAAEGLEASYELRMGEDRFRAEVTGGGFEVERGSAERPDATIEADSNTLAELIYNGRPLSEALRSGDVKIECDEAAVERFLTLFPLPEPAVLAAR